MLPEASIISISPTVLIVSVPFDEITIFSSSLYLFELKMI